MSNGNDIPLLSYNNLTMILTELTLLNIMTR